MLNEPNSAWLVIGVLVGMALVISSFIVVLKEGRFYDHVSRSLVATGVGAVSVSAGFLLYNSKLVSDLESDRLLATQSFRRATLQYGIVAYHLQATRLYCDIDTEDTANKPGPKKSKFDSADCRQASAIATKTASLLPGVEFIFNQAAKGSRAFPAADRIAVFVTDGDTALRGRMPAVIDSNISVYVARGKSQLAKAAAAKFAGTMSDLQMNGEATAAVYCILTDRISKGWSEFDDAVFRLDHGLKEEEPSIYPAIVRQLAAQTPFQASDCTNIRHELQSMLPATGGGDGGGNGGGD